LSRRSPDEIHQLVRSPDHIFLVEDALSQPPEKSRHPLFHDVPAQAQERGGRIEIASNRHHVFLVSAGPVQQQKHAIRRACLRWNEAMDEIHKT
jgi:hypothetical protein